MLLKDTMRVQANRKSQNFFLLHWEGRITMNEQGNSQSTTVGTGNQEKGKLRFDCQLASFSVTPLPYQHSVKPVCNRFSFNE